LRRIGTSPVHVSPARSAAAHSPTSGAPGTHRSDGCRPTSSSSEKPASSQSFGVRVLDDAAVDVDHQDPGGRLLDRVPHLAELGAVATRRRVQRLEAIALRARGLLGALAGEHGADDLGDELGAHEQRRRPGDAPRGRREGDGAVRGADGRRERDGERRAIAVVAQVREVDRGVFGQRLDVGQRDELPREQASRDPREEAVRRGAVGHGRDLVERREVREPEDVGRGGRALPDGGAVGAEQLAERPLRRDDLGVDGLERRDGEPRQAVREQRLELRRRGGRVGGNGP
jgi:hypothetical protein